MEHAKALNIARFIHGALEPHCEAGRCVVGGSIARMRSEVKDIEIICQPKRIASQDLFGPSGTFVDPAFLEAGAKLGVIARGSFTGRACQIMLPYGINVDIFIPQPADFFRILTIRTGSAAWVKQFIATAWVREGWVGTPDGLRLRQECHGTDMGGGKTRWACKVDEPTLPPVWQSEAEFFTWLGVRHIGPPSREYIGK